MSLLISVIKPIHLPQPLIVAERPAVKPSGKRAQFIVRSGPPGAKLMDTHTEVRNDIPGTRSWLPSPERPELFNRVVRIDGEDAYEYWYVLTYLPDLQWCHVAPLERRGEFEAPSSSAGRYDVCIDSCVHTCKSPPLEADFLCKYEFSCLSLPVLVGCLYRRRGAVRSTSVRGVVT